MARMEKNYLDKDIMIDIFIKQNYIYQLADVRFLFKIEKAESISSNQYVDREKSQKEFSRITRENKTFVFLTI